VWSKSTPYLKLPTVCSPAVVNGKLIFGDGMHQTDGATLHCITIDKGFPQWQLPVPGKLVHLEGSPTIEAGKAYIGGGAAGVLCVDIEKVTLEGKEMDLKSIEAILAKRWKELLAKYDKKDPFAIPPSEDQLSRANPTRVWQQGDKVWHVDAPVNVVGDRVLVCSAFLDKEKEGERALICLDTAKGTKKWQTPLKLNPWGGASVHDNIVVVTGSTIGYDTNALKGAKGQVAAFDLADGKEKWKKDIPKGGIVSCAAIADGKVIATATDGKVRTWDLATGEAGPWIYDGKSPFFAPPAVAAGVIYAGDLKGVLHAIDMKTGQARWTLDVGSHPATKAPGMFYAGPVVHDGRLYAATCNLEGPNAREATVVVCIGEK
jgi:outer membrane protein assembly factor BamB